MTLTWEEVHGTPDERGMNDLIRKLEAEVDRLKKQTHWIPVEVSLPTEERTYPVLIYDEKKKKYMHTSCRFENGRWKSLVRIHCWQDWQPVFTPEGGFNA